MAKSIFLTLIHMIFIGGTFLPLMAEARKNNYEASFQVNGEPTSTVEEFTKRLQDLYPSVPTQKSTGGSLEYRGREYASMVFQTEGVLFDSKVEQTLTYIQIYTGLWKMLYVEGNSCVKGVGLEGGEWVKGWKCRPIENPLTGAFSDIFLIADLETNIEALSTEWGRKVELRSEEEVLQVETTPAETLMTLGDMKALIIELGGTWREESATWTSYSGTASGPALKIYVETQLDSFNVSQNFLYYIDGDLLLLKEIDGLFCQYVERVGKEICDSNHDAAYMPTSVTPFKMKLVNSLEISENSPNTEHSQQTDSQDPSLFPCGNTGANFEMALRIHFEQSTFGIKDSAMHKAALLRLPEALDPLSLFTSKNKISELVTDSLVDEMRVNLGRGRSGRCDSVLPILAVMREGLMDRVSDLGSFISDLRKANFILSDEGQLSSEHAKMTAYIRQVSEASPLATITPQGAVEVAAADLKRYFRKSLDLLAAPEELLTSAYVKLDAYSTLLPEALVAQKNITLKGSGQKKLKYFGLSVSKGVIDHYIVRLHPYILKISKLRVGDKILNVNGTDARTLSAQELDNILMDHSRSLVLDIQKENSTYTFVLNSSPLDMMELFYSITLKETKSNGVIVKIKITEFHAGLSTSLRKALKSKIEGLSVKGYILDLQSNPGGNADEALNVANFFIKEGVLSYYRFGSRGTVEVSTLEAKEDLSVSDDIPLVVLINEKTASSAEILAATLKAYKRAVLVGTQTFGKHVAQTYWQSPLSDGRELMMLVTSTEYYDPNGKSLNGIGVRPDIVTSSQEHSKFLDGNRSGQDYTPSEGLQSFTPHLTTSALSNIQGQVVLDQTSPESVALLILN